MRAITEVRPGKIELLQRRTRDNIPLLNEIGFMLSGRFKSTFRTEGRGKTKWPPRKVPSVPGILQDLAIRKEPREQRFQPRPALMITGLLRNSITWRILGQNAVEIGTNVPYAGIHQRGGITTIKVTKTIQRNLSAWTKKHREFGWIWGLIKKGRGAVRWRVAKRPFVELIPQDRKDLDTLVKMYVDKGSRRII